MYSPLFNEIINSLQLKKQILNKVAEYSHIPNQDPEIIRSLYGIKSEPEDILDAAHPETAVVSDTYDAMNGVVENLKERQNIMGWIATKMPEGAHLARRYVKASNELLHELIKAASVADASNNVELAKLADNCTKTLSKNSGIAAGIGLGIWTWRALQLSSLIGGYLALTQNRGFSEGIVNDVSNAIKELSEVSSKSYPRTQSQIVVLVTKLNEFKKDLNDYLSTNIIVSNEMTANDYLKIRQDPSAMAQLKKAEKYQASVNELSLLLPNYIEALKNSVVQESSAGSFLQGLNKIYELFDPNDLDDAVVALELLQRTLADEQKRLMNDVEVGYDKTLKQIVSETNELQEFGKGPLVDLVTKLVQV